MRVHMYVFWGEMSLYWYGATQVRLATTGLCGLRWLVRL